MAQDKIASLLNEAVQSKKIVAKKMRELKDLTADEIFVPIPGSASNFILGPCFKTTLPPTLSRLYPLAEGEKLLLHSAEADWFECKGLKNSWPCATESWIAWVDRVEKSKGEIWKSVGVYDAIQLSKLDIPKDENLLFAALCYWSIATNSFHFRFGMMGPTVLDIVALTGLRPHGEVVYTIAMAGPTVDFPKWDKIYNSGISYERRASNEKNVVTEEEHISFLVRWICKHLYCYLPVAMMKQCTKLAYALAAGRKIALAPFVLSNFYHGCTEIIKGRFNDARGPFWILQLWLQSYFPEFQPATLDNSTATTYGYSLAEGVLRRKSFKKYFLFFHQCSSTTPSQFTPFSSRKFGPEWFKRSLDPNIQKLNGAELQEIWASYLVSRDLPYSILLNRSAKWKNGMEYYSPNQFARQFGMTQDVPLNQSVYRISITREDIQSSDHIEETESRFVRLKRTFKFLPFDTNPSSTEFFDSWWSTYINTRDRTASDVLRKISPHVMPLHPSDRQEVAALRSDDINGTSQSEGNVCQNTKRKYQEDIIPSQSLDEQEEPRLKRHSNEAGEMISTGTLCQVPGIPSTVPSALAFPTICAVLAAEEVKAAPARYLVKVESFSELKGMNKYETSMFLSCGYKWKMIIYPDGDGSEDGRDHISVCLAIAETSSLPAGWDVNATFSFLIFDQIRGKFIIMRGMEVRFHNVKTEWCFSKCMSHATFKEPSNGYLVNDKCVFGVDVYSIKNQQGGECISFLDDIKPCKHEWKISEFSKLKKELYSEEFSVGNCKWKLLGYPMGDSRENGKSISLFLVSVDAKGFDCRKRLHTKWSISIKNQTTGADRTKQGGPRWFTSAQGSWGWSAFMTLSELKDPKNGYLVNDCCIVEAEVSPLHVVNGLP